MRICSLVPGTTEIAFALGLGDEIVAVSHECDFPPQAVTKPVVVRSMVHSEALTSAEIHREITRAACTGQSLYRIDEQALREAAPDIILTQNLCGVCALDYDEIRQAARALSPTPIFLSFAPNSIEDLLQDILRLGEATRRTAAAEALVARLRTRIEEVRALSARASSLPRIACLEWFDPLYSAGHWIPEMVAVAGGIDHLGIPGEASAKLKWQTLVDFRPEIIVLMACGFDVGRTVDECKVLQKLDGWNTLPAVQASAVYAVDGNSYFSRPGPRLIEGLELIAYLAHPEIFPAPPSYQEVKQVTL